MKKKNRLVAARVRRVREARSEGRLQLKLLLHYCTYFVFFIEFIELK